MLWFSAADGVHSLQRPCIPPPNFMAEIKWRDLSSTDNCAGEQAFCWTETPPRPNLYDLLEVSPAASLEVIKAAYRALMAKYHPDKNPEHLRSRAEEASRELNHAYAVLSNPRTRREHDCAHGIR